MMGNIRKYLLMLKKLKYSRKISFNKDKNLYSSLPTCGGVYRIFKSNDSKTTIYVGTLLSKIIA